MSDSEPRRARHSLVEDQVETGGSDAPTAAVASGAALFAERTASFPGEYTDDATCVLPVIPAQRAGSPSESTVPPYVPVQPSGPPLGYGAVKAPSVYPSGPAASSVPRRRMRPAILAGVTAVLLVAGVAVGSGGIAPVDPAQDQGTSATP